MALVTGAAAAGPFISYYGSKWRAASLYDPPQHRTIVEPFAGGAGYSCRFPARDVILVDADEHIAGVWSYLIRTPAAEIMRLRAPVDHVDEIDGPQEARWLVGFWLNNGGASPCKTPGKWNRVAAEKGHAQAWGPRCRERLARSVESIRHWKIIHGTYRDAPSCRATWFVDPPYDGRAGSFYRHGSGRIDYSDLAAWCMSLDGQVQVCEADGATWLPFEPFGTIQASPGARRKGSSHEAIWRNYVARQTSLWRP